MRGASHDVLYEKFLGLRRYGAVSSNCGRTSEKVIESGTVQDLISTVVDPLSMSVSEIVYKPYLISTVVDVYSRSVKFAFINPI